MDKYIYLLEYSEEQKCFHNNCFDRVKGEFDAPIGENGYRPVMWMTEEMAKDEEFNTLQDIVLRGDYAYEKVWRMFNTEIGRYYTVRPNPSLSSPSNKDG